MSPRVVVVGDGPAGSALAGELTDRLGAGSVTLVGLDRPWTATYGAWVDEVDDLGGRAAPFLPELADVVPDIRFATGPRVDRMIGRAYAVVANVPLRRRLRAGVSHRHGEVEDVRYLPDGRVAVTVDGEVISADLVFDATGWPGALVSPDGSEPMAWQTAWGVVLPGPPPGALAAPTVMDWSAPGGVDHGTATFAYSLPVDDGWLVEETVLASTPAIEPDDLRPVLARRLGVDAAALEAGAVRVERVRIPMGAPIPSRRGPVNGHPAHAFGAAAGFAHPATGYQLVAALEAAPRVASAVAEALTDDPARRIERVAAAVWPPAWRRTRRLHEFGLDVLLRLDPADTRRFFETFFELPATDWSAQLRVGTPPRRIARVMAKMFAASPGPLRRQLLAGDLRRLARVVRP